MRIVLCDDDANQLTLMSKYIGDWAAKTNTKVELIKLTSAEEFLMNFPNAIEFDAVFLDIQMGRINGVELAHMLRKANPLIAIIFVTGMREHILEGYEVGALHYLIKPVSEQDCYKCLDRLLSNPKMEASPSFIVSNEWKSLRIPYAEILYFEALAHSCVAHTVGDADDHRFKMRFADLEEQLSPKHFIKVHRSYIANISFMRKIDKNGVEMDGGTVLAISKGRRDDVNNAFVKYFANSI